MASVLVVDDSGGRRLATLLEWSHASGEQAKARCLARLLPGGQVARTIVVLSELRENPRGLGLASDVAGAAQAVLRFARRYADLDGADLDDASTVWLLHHGEFSSHDAFGAPETLTLAQPDGVGLDGAGQELLTHGPVLDEIRAMQLAPVDAVVDQLHSIRI